MSFLTVGVEHQTAPLAVRERLAMDPETVGRVSSELASTDAIEEIVIVSTCNRTELYLFAEDAVSAAAAARAILVERDGSVVQYLRVREEMQAAEHLFRVACGLESQVLGEPQVLGQVRESMEVAQERRVIGANLHALFRGAIACSRRARSETTLGRIQASLGSEAVRAAEEELGSLEGRAALLIGGGEIARLVGEELQKRHCGVLYIANRTASVAENLASRFGAEVWPFSSIGEVLGRVDLVVSATSAFGQVLTESDIRGGFPERRQPLAIFDLAMPRDVDPLVGRLPGIVLHDLDSLLPTGLDHHMQADVAAVEAIVAAELHDFNAWYLTRRVVPVIANLRSHVEAVSEEELRRVAPQLAGLSEREWAAVESLTGRLVDKMFHHLVVRLKLAAQTDPKLVEAAEFFFLHGEGSLFDHAADRERDASPTPEGARKESAGPGDGH